MVKSLYLPPCELEKERGLVKGKHTPKSKEKMVKRKVLFISRGYKEVTYPPWDGTYQGGDLNPLIIVEVVHLLQGFPSAIKIPLIVIFKDAR